MTEGVIDPLEAVEVQIQQYPDTVSTFAPQQKVFHRLVETPTIEQPGQRVGDRLILQLLVQMTHDRHVQHRHHHGLLLGG
ncbi:hypothetical protein D3C87_1494590 [compost metagenome]